MVVIEINPRTSRSSALASKATGFPIALVSAKLAGGLTLDEIPYWRDGTLEKYTPSGDYVVVKFSRWAFEKFKGAEDKLGTQMRAVGEVMSIGKTYKEAFQKAIRSLENGRHGLGFAKDFNQQPLAELMRLLNEPSSERQWIMYEALRKGATVEELYAKTYIKPWFIQQMKELVELEEKILKYKGKALPDDLLVQAKKDGFADKYLGKLLGVPEAKIREQRKRLGVVEAWDALPVSGVENAAYYYSTYNRPDKVAVQLAQEGHGARRRPQPHRPGHRVRLLLRPRRLRPARGRLRDHHGQLQPGNRLHRLRHLGQALLRAAHGRGRAGIYEKEKPEGVVVQFGGQTPLNIANELAAAGVKILGTSPDTIDLAEDRDRFRKMMEKMGIPMPESGMASSFEEAQADRRAHRLPGHGAAVLRARRTRHGSRPRRGDAPGIRRRGGGRHAGRPILIDRFLDNAIEAEADALADGTDAFVPAVMEHIELAGIHSGDSACAIPPVTLPEKHIKTIEEYTLRISRELKVCGVMNIQYAICQDKVYVLEANPRASRTVPLVSKVCNVPDGPHRHAAHAGREAARTSKLQRQTIPHVGVKEVVLPFNMFPEVDPVLGPEMRSTGEVLGMAPTFGLAYFKAQEAALPPAAAQGHGVHLRHRPGQAGHPGRRPQVPGAGLPHQGHQRHLRVPAAARREVRAAATRSTSTSARTSPTRSRARKST